MEDCFTVVYVLRTLVHTTFTDVLGLISYLFLFNVSIVFVSPSLRVREFCIKIAAPVFCVNESIKIAFKPRLLRQ